MQSKNTTERNLVVSYIFPLVTFCVCCIMVGWLLMLTVSFKRDREALIVHQTAFQHLTNNLARVAAPQLPKSCFTCHEN